MISDFKLSFHAIEQIERRAIDIQLVYDVLQQPQQIIELENETVFQSIITIQQKNFLMRIFVNEKVIPKLVITVYLTSKIDKYYES